MRTLEEKPQEAPMIAWLNALALCVGVFAQSPLIIALNVPYAAWMFAIKWKGWYS